jgi:hypothetical protein
VSNWHSPGRRLDELHHVIGVGDHRHVVRGDFDGGGPHALGEQPLGIRRNCLIAIASDDSLLAEPTGFRARDSLSVGSTNANVERGLPTDLPRPFVKRAGNGIQM